jgi:predicted membrane-bound mannosyltransferase
MANAENRGGRLRLVIFSTLLFLVSAAWRLPLINHSLVIDETLHAVPTVQEFLKGHWLIYSYGCAYMAPVQEAISALLAHFWGQSLFNLRLPCILFYGAGCVIIFFVLRNVVSTNIAFLLALFLACENSVVVSYSTLAIPDWGVGMALVALVQLLSGFNVAELHCGSRFSALPRASRPMFSSFLRFKQAYRFSGS